MGRLFCCFLLLIALLSPGDVRGQVSKPAGGKSAPPREEVAEPPLPHGVIAQLGTSMYRGKSEGGIVILPDNRTFVTDTGFWDLRSGRRLRDFSTGDNAVRRMSLTPSKDGFATLGFRVNAEEGVIEKWLRVWNLDGTPKTAVRSTDDRGEAISFSISPDQRFAVIGGSGMPLHVFDLKTSKLLKSVDVPGDGRVDGLVFSPDGAAILMTGNAGVFRWVWQNEEERPVATKWTRSRATDLKFTPDGKKLVIASQMDRGTVYVVDYSTQQVVNILHLEAGGTEWRSLAISSESRLLYLASGQKAVEAWDLTTATKVQSFDARPTSLKCVALSADDQWLAIGGAWDTRIRVWNTQTGEQLPSPVGHDNPIVAIAFSPDGKAVLTGSDDASARLWSAETGELLASFAHEKGQVRAIAFSHDGNMIATSAGDPAVHVWDRWTGRELKTIPGHGGFQRRVQFAPDDEVLLVWGDNKELRRWHVRTGEQLGAFPAGSRQGQRQGFDEFELTRAWFSSNGRTIAVGERGEFGVYDTADGHRIGTVKDQGFVDDTGISPEGDLLAVNVPGKPFEIPLKNGRSYGGMSREPTLTLFSVKTGEALWKAPLQPGHYSPPAFSADGSVVAVAQREKRGPLIVFDVATGRENVRIENERFDGWFLAVSPTGDRVAAPLYEGYVHLWDLSQFLAR